MTQRPVLVVATRNPGKFREIRSMLDDLPLDVLDPGDLPEVEETGSTFTENAALKAQAAARYFKLWSLGDDSGLEVDALGGLPGIYSARYGAPHAKSDADRNELLLSRLTHVPENGRGARFRAAIAIASPGGETWISEGACEGRIGFTARGNSGFGYDPLFYVEDLGVTMAEIDPELKDRISHRARAMEAARQILQELLLSRGDLMHGEQGGPRTHG